MARIRSIKPEVRTSLVIASWPREVRLFWFYLWGYCDDYGRGVDDARLVRAETFPLDDDLTALDIETWLEIIAESGLLCRYQVDGMPYLHSVFWSDEQRPQHPTKSKLPPCPDCLPDDHRRWRETNPERPKPRSRRVREEVMNACGGFTRGPAELPAAPEPPAAPEDFANVSGEAHETAEPPPPARESAGHTASGTSPESLTNLSGALHGIFSPEQGNKGTRERGARGRANGPLSPDWQPSEQARLRAAADITRLGADGTTYVIRKFVAHGYEFRTAAEADRQWVRWMSREDPKKNPAAARPTPEPDAYAVVAARMAAVGADDHADDDTAPARHLQAVPDTSPTQPDSEGRAAALAAARAARTGYRARLERTA